MEKETEIQSLTNFPALLKTYRKGMGWTQGETATRWGYSFESISAWERGKRSPSSHEVPRLARLLDIELDLLVECINTNRRKSLQNSSQELIADESKYKWKNAFDTWGEIQGIYRNRTEFDRAISYPRLFEDAKNINAIGISLNALTISYSHDKIIESIIKNNALYQLCFLDPDGMKCIEREREEGHRQGFLADLTRLNMYLAETLKNRLNKVDSKYAKQLRISTYDLTPQFNIYVVDNTLMTVQCYAYNRGEDTPLFVLKRQGRNGLFDFYVSAAEHILGRAQTLLGEQVEEGNSHESEYRC